MAKMVFKYSFVVILAIFASVNIASAQQQKWASQYVKWTFAKSVDVINIDQEVWVPKPNQTSYMPLQWNWKGGTGDDGGYMGLQQAADVASQNVRFSLWNASAASGANCQKFGGEGIGYTCTLAVKIDTTKFYRLRLWKVETDKTGQWWGGWLISVENGRLVEHLIGKIKVAAKFKVVDPASITNFVEFWGDHISPCGKVPPAVIAFAPPAVNYQGKKSGIYEATAKYAGSDRAADNVCFKGTEKDGALVTAKKYNFGFANGAMMFLGGSILTPTLDPKKYPTPPRMPNS